MEHSVSQIAVLTSKTNEIISRLTFIEDKEELDNVRARLASVLNKRHMLLNSLDEVSSSGNVCQISDLSENNNEKLFSLIDDVAVHLEVNKRQEKHLEQLNETRQQFIIATAPVSDDALFNLITGLDEIEEREESKHDYEKLEVEAEVLSSALEIKANGLLLIGLLETGLNYEEIESISTLEERFEATLGRLKRHFRHLIEMGGNDFLSVQVSIKAIEKLGTDKHNVFFSQRLILQQHIDFEKNIKRIDTIRNAIERKIKELSIIVQQEAEFSKSAVDRTIANGKAIIISVAILSLLGSLFNTFAIKQPVFLHESALEQESLQIAV
jgi:hypothetical protein